MTAAVPSRSYTRCPACRRSPRIIANLEIDVLLDDRNVELVQEEIDVASRMGRLLADSSLTVRRIASGRHGVLGVPVHFARAAARGAR